MTRHREMGCLQNLKNTAFLCRIQRWERDWDLLLHKKMPDIFFFLNTMVFKFKVSKILLNFFRKKLILLFSKGTLNRSKVTVKTKYIIFIKES